MTAVSAQYADNELGHTALNETLKPGGSLAQAVFTLADLSATKSVRQIGVNCCGSFYEPVHTYRYVADVFFVSVVKSADKSFVGPTYRSDFVADKSVSVNSAYVQSENLSLH